MAFWGVGPYENEAALDVIERIRQGQFSMARFQFSFSGRKAVDMEDGAQVLALWELINNPNSLPAAITRDMLEDIDTPANRCWLRDERLRVLNPQSSGLYALWEETGLLTEWLLAS